MTKQLWILLGLASAAVVIQQQLLLRRLPRLVASTPQTMHSGSAAIDLRFSRPMQRASLAASTTLSPQLNHRWLGDHNPLRLVIDSDEPIEQPLALRIAGEDRRGQALEPKQTWWDPRPWLLATRVIDGGQQLQLLDRSGQWRALSPIWSSIQSVVPLGNGRGIAMVSSTGNNSGEQIWLRRLSSHSMESQDAALQPPSPEPLQRLVKTDVLFAHLSSNLNGDLLVQTGGFTPGSKRIQLFGSDGSRRELDQLASGPMQLLPAGGGLVVPTYNGLSLRPLIDNNRKAQILPGSRELGAFCAASGRAVLIRHWPDYRRSIELVIPGSAPKQLLLGEQAILAVGCNGSGERIWVVLGSWKDQRGEHEILLMDGSGTILQRKRLDPWTLKAGSPLQFDPVTRKLLMTVRRPELENGRAALMDSETLKWESVLPVPISEAQWLPAG